MLNYKGYENKVYDWLISKHQQDSSFTFSLRQMGSKGAETDYFIGKEKSGYFSTTFWYLPVSFPGSSGDCLGLIFWYTKTGYNYHFEFTQTKTPHDDQNRAALALVKLLQETLQNPIGFRKQPTEKTKMFTLKTKTAKASYDTVEEMFIDIEKDLTILFPIVDEAIATVKRDYPDFKANRITTTEFETFSQKLSNRLKKHENMTFNAFESLDTIEENDTQDGGINSQPLNKILYGPPGTGKTYNTINKALEIINDEEVKKLDFDDRIAVKALFDKRMEEGQIVFTTFHQSMSYEDFIEGIKPETLLGNVTYDVIPGIFLDICDLAQNNWENVKEGNKSKLSFEEAFSQLKEDWEEDLETKFPLKTKGKDFTIIGFTKKSIQFRKASGGTGHTLSIGTLKDYYYKKKEVRTTGVGIYYPSILDRLNKYQPEVIIEKKLKNYILIIDEINRGNVSQIFGELITLIEEDKRLGKDEALEVTLPYSKEKFGVPPNLYIIGTMNTADRSVEALDTALRRRFSFEEMPPRSKVVEEKAFGDYPRVAIMEKINNRIELLLDRNHTLGHAYFIKENFKNSFENEIIPLLQEYFYNDYGKIGLVLGKGFVRDNSITILNGQSVFADFETKNEVDIVKSYELIPFAAVEFETALQTLLA